MPDQRQSMFDAVNQAKSKYPVELRSDAIKKNPKGWADLIGREGIDWLSQSDPIYQRIAHQFVASMTPEQLADAQEQYKQQKGEGSFEDWLHKVQAQEYIGGFLAPEGAPGWTGPKGEGRYTPGQLNLLNSLKNYLSQ